MIYVLSGGQTGATLTVTSSGAGTITVSNASLGKSYSKSVTAGGSAVFKGLATGTWTVKLSNGTQTSTKTIKITSDYSTSIAYFSATIKVTYPAKSKCVIKNSSGTQVASDTNAGTSAKTWTATVNATGTYTVTATATDGSGKSKSQSVSITADGQSKSVTLSYELDIFANGVLDSSVTGGFENSDVLSIVDNNLEVSYGATVVGEAGGKDATTKNSIDISNYDNVKLDVVSISNSGPFTNLQDINLQLIRNNRVLAGVSLKSYENQTAIIPLDKYKSGGAVQLRFSISFNEGSISALVSRFYLE